MLLIIAKVWGIWIYILVAAWLLHMRGPIVYESFSVSFSIVSAVTAVLQSDAI